MKTTLRQQAAAETTALPTIYHQDRHITVFSVVHSIVFETHDALYS
jgi:hypothetical protein